MDVSDQLVFSIHWCPPKSLLSLDIWYILLPENKYHLIFFDIAQLSSCREYNLFSCPSDENHVTEQI